MTTNYERILVFEQTATSYLKRDAKNQDTKLGYAILKVLKSPDYTKIKKDIQKGSIALNDETKTAIEDAEIDLCQVDKDGSILYDVSTDKNGNPNRVYKFTKDAMKKRNKKIYELKKAYENKVEEYMDKVMADNYDIKPYMATVVPPGLAESEIDAFKGFVITDDFIYSNNGELRKEPKLEVVGNE